MQYWYKRNKTQENSECLKSLIREVTTHIRTDAQGGPLIPVFGVKTPHEIIEMKEEILWNKHFITIGGKSIF